MIWIVVFVISLLCLLAGRKWVNHDPPQPGEIVFDAIGEDEMGLITFDIQLPEVGAPDVVEREFTLQVNGGEKDVRSLSGDARVVEGLAVEEGSSIELLLVDIDDAGNRSEPSGLITTVRDTFPPAKPGDMRMTVTGEVFDTPTPAPEPTPEPVEPQEIVDTILEEVAEEPVSEESETV